MKNLQFVINEQGEQVAVLLDVAEYRRLIQQTPADTDLLAGLSLAELEALADSILAPTAQARLNELLAQNQAEQLSPEREAELDHLLEQVDQLTLLKTRAKYTLDCHKTLTTAA